MDLELKAAIGEIKEAAKEATAAATKAEDAARDATSAARAASNGLDELRNIALRNHADTNAKIIAVNRNLGVLWRRVNGSNPPPPDPNIAPTEYASTIGPDGERMPSMPPLDEVATQAQQLASSASLEVAALEGRMISGFSSLERKVMDELKKQSQTLGVGVQGLKWLGTKEGAKTLAVVAAAIFSGYVAVRPAPKAEVQAAQPTPQVVVLSAPPASAVTPTISASAVPSDAGSTATR